MATNQVKMPKPPKRFERQFAEFTVFMIEQMAQRFKNQTLNELNKGTIEKFADAQVGNYARVYLSLANRVTRKLKKQFNNKRLNLVTSDILGRADKYNKDQVYESAGQAIGIDKMALIAKEGLTPQINALMLETEQWTKKLRDDTLEFFTANTLRAMTTGASLEDIFKEFDQEVLKHKNKAKFIARNQIANFNGISTKIRHQKLGIKKGIWITSRDERVRNCHQVRDGKEFDLATGLYSSCDGKTLIPGQDYQCRCIYRAILPEIDE